MTVRAPRRMYCGLFHRSAAVRTLTLTSGVSAIDFNNLGGLSSPSTAVVINYGARNAKQDAECVFERTNSIGWKLRMRPWSKHAQEGMTLIEVLVALLILGVGLLGAAAVQLNALKYTDSARMTSQASFIAYDMLDRIRANAAADYTVTPPTAGNLNVARDQDLYDFTITSSISVVPRRPAVSP